MGVEALEKEYHRGEVPFSTHQLRAQLKSMFLITSDANSGYLVPVVSARSLSPIFLWIESRSSPYSKAGGGEAGTFSLRWRFKCFS